MPEEGEWEAMRMDKGDFELMELLRRAIHDFEKIEDDQKTMNFIARRIGNIVKHMKDLRDDLRPRGNSNGRTHEDVTDQASLGVSPGTALNLALARHTPTGRRVPGKGDLDGILSPHDAPPAFRRPVSSG